MVMTAGGYRHILGWRKNIGGAMREILKSDDDLERFVQSTIEQRCMAGLTDG